MSRKKQRVVIALVIFLAVVLVLCVHYSFKYDNECAFSDSKEEQLLEEESHDMSIEDEMVAKKEVASRSSERWYEMSKHNEEVVLKENQVEIIIESGNEEDVAEGGDNTQYSQEEQEYVEHESAEPPIAVVMNAQSLEVINLVNQQRSAHGMPALVTNSSLNSSALVRAKELEVRYSHIRPDGQGPNTALNVGVKSFGENIAYGYTSSSSVVAGWMASSEHREGILNSEYNATGVGVIKGSDGVVYWVQIFAKI